MRKVLMAFVVLSFPVVVSAQQFRDASSSNANQAAGIAADTSARDAALDRAALDMIHKDYAGAADVYRALLRQSPNDSVTWNRLGIAYHQQTLLGDALKCYERSTKADKKNGDGWNNIGTVYFQEKKFAKAIRAYKKAIALNGNRATYYGNIGVAYMNNKKVSEALESFRQAVKLDPDVFTGTSSYGTVLQDRSVGNRGMFFFMMAKSFAGNRERRALRLLFAEIARRRLRGFRQGHDRSGIFKRADESSGAGIAGLAGAAASTDYAVEGDLGVFNRT